jgi:hypothetical protein
MNDKPHMIPVSFKWARKEGKVKKCYALWRKSTSHLSPETVCYIDGEWREDSVRLMVPEEEWEKLINPK